MSRLNDVQSQISKKLDGMVVVDAGPGTGKTHTMVERYCNILSVPDIDPRDVLLMTFTNNAAEEMRERLESRLGNDRPIQATTFDAFCLDLVMDSAESVSDALGFKETLTRGASLIESRTLNLDHFRKMYGNFMKEHSGRYKGLSAIAGGHVDGLFDLMEKLMSRGMIPLPDYDWLGDTDVLEGDLNGLSERLRSKNGKKLAERAIKGLEDDVPEWYSDELEEIPEDVLKDAVNEDRRYLIWMVHDIYREYLRTSISDNRLTFGIVELFAMAALHSDANVRKRFSYRYVMIDEFQDTNELQLRIAMLILREPNLCAVGDWKQGIYGFRNVSIDNIIDFESKVVNARRELNKGGKRIQFMIDPPVKFKLTENYRSSQTIIDAAFHALTIKASEKDEVNVSDVVMINATRSEIGEKTKFEMICAESYEKEIHMIAQKVHEYVSSGEYVICDDDGERSPRYSDIAVLCRKNEMGRNIRDRMIELGIPAFLQGDAKIMSSREAKLALAWLRYVNNGNDPRGPVAIMSDMGYSMAEIESCLLTNDRKIPSDIQETRKQLISKKRRMTSLLTSIFSIYGLNNDTTQAIISVISSAHRSTLLTVSDVIRLIENDMERSETYEMDPSLDREAVTVQTMHKSKGLEYPIVIVAGLNSRSFPRHESAPSGFVIDDLCGIRVTDEYVESNRYHRIRRSWRWNVVSGAREFDYDEQRRLLFVAISRAKQYVTLTSSNPSPFMKGYGESHIMMTEPTLSKMDRKDKAGKKERPVIPENTEEGRFITPHDLMGEFEETGGKGIEYGNKVHDIANKMAYGIPPKEDVEEIPEIQRILDSVKGAEIWTEVKCTLPLEGKVIRGVIDLLAVFPDRVEVHDYKTDADDSNLDRYKIQLSIYAAAASAHFERPAVCFIDYVSQKINIRFDPLPLERIVELVKSHI